MAPATSEIPRRRDVVFIMGMSVPNARSAFNYYKQYVGRAAPRTFG
jgi:hypothetical protein